MNLQCYETGRCAPAFNMALDEALLEMAIDTKITVPVLRLYGWTPAAVTLGYAQDWHVEADHTACERNGVPVIRRISGGGAVFHDNEVTYSLVIPEKTLGDNVLESFREVSLALVSALSRFGLKGEFAPINDITVNGRKISGNAQIRRRGMILQHGTVLLGVDRELMFTLLTVPADKVKRKKLERALDRVTSVSDETNSAITFDQGVAAMKNGFAEWAGEKLEIFTPPDTLTMLTETIGRNRFSNEAWNRFRRYSEI